MEVGLVVEPGDVDKILHAYADPRGVVSLVKLCEEVDPQAFSFIFPTATQVSTGASQMLVERSIRANESPESIRNQIRAALRRRAGEEGTQNVVLAFRSHDPARSGLLAKASLRSALERLGLKIAPGPNLSKAWDALIAAHGARDLDGSTKLDIHALLLGMQHDEAEPSSHRPAIYEFKEFFFTEPNSDTTPVAPDE